MNDIGDRDEAQKKLDTVTSNIQDTTDALSEMAVVFRHVALRFRLLGDPDFLIRPTPIEFSHN